MDERIEKEIQRLRNGPLSGWFTLLHHEGPVVEQSTNLFERVDYILATKPANEIYDRLRHIYPISPELANDYYAKRKLLTNDYDAKCKLLDDDVLAGVPNNNWDGSSIFGNLRK